MKKNQHKTSVAVGFFIIMALIVFSLGLYVLGNKQSTFGKTISVTSMFENVTGLKTGSNILLGGVKVGIVKSIKIISGNMIEVTMQIEDDKKSYIPKDAIVRLGNDGFVGNKVLDIYGGHIQHGAVSNGTVLQSERGTSMEQMMNTLQVNNNNLIAITTDLKQISRKILNGEGTLGALINDASLANNLQALINKLHISANNAQKLTSDVAAFTGKLDKPGTMTYNVINDTIVFTRLQSAARQLDAMAGNAQAIVNKLNQTADKLNDTDKPAGMVLNDEKTAAELKKIISNLQSGTEKLNDTFEALRHNFLLRGSFRKMEKERAKDSTP